MGSAVMPGQGNFMGEGSMGGPAYVQNPGMPSVGGPRPVRPGGMVRPGFPSGQVPGPGLIGGGPMPTPGPGWTSGIKPPPQMGVGEGVLYPGMPVQNPGMPVKNPGMPVQNPGMPVPRPGPGNAIGGVAPNPGMGDPFSGVSRGRLAEAQRLAALGKMGRAKQQVELGGGAWNPAMHRALKTGGLLGQ